MATLLETATKLARVTWKTAAVTVGAATVFAFVPAPAHATPVITNGNFETLSPSTTGSTEFGTLYGGQVVSGWTSKGYNFLFMPGTADTTGAANQYGGRLKFWGPGDKLATELANSLPAASPAGGNFIGADGAFLQGPLQQTITGLDMNSVASITFDWAGAQQYTFNGQTTEAWQVTLGNETHSTPVVSNVTHGFTGWQTTTLSFIVTSTTEVLSFLALGTPTGVPPFSLLDGVSISEIPEPASLTLVGLGLVLTAFVKRRRSLAA